MHRLLAGIRRVPTSLRLAGRALRSWGPRQILTAVLAALSTAVLIGVATVLIPNAVFTREIPPVWWNYPLLLLTAAMSGLLIASYVRVPGVAAPDDSPRGGRFGLAGGLLAWFAVGCPVCNKIALLALGYTGALTWFAPLQPFLAVTALALSTVAVVWRLQGQVACPLPSVPTAVRA